jgi:CheY-like chemotaxis protein
MEEGKRLTRRYCQRACPSRIVLAHVPRRPRSRQIFNVRPHRHAHAQMKTKNITILAIDDSEDDQTLLTRAFRQNGVTCPINWVGGGEEAIAYLMGEGKFSDRSRFPYPSFVMTDLKMPCGDGFSVLQYLKSTPEWAVIPTVVFSASDDLDDIKRSYMLGAGSYIVKPTDFAEMRECLRVFYDYWMWCETPAIDTTGKRLHTDSKGKLGERFLNQGDNEVA